MAEEGIRFEPERRKKDQVTTHGRGQTEMIGVEGGMHQRITRRYMTPAELAAYKLNQALEKYPEFTKEARENIQNEFVNIDGLRTMNMKLLAATLSFLRSVNNQPTPASFRDEYIVPYMTQLLNPDKLDPDELKRLIIRYKAQMVTYIEVIKKFRNINQ